MLLPGVVVLPKIQVRYLLRPWYAQPGTDLAAATTRAVAAQCWRPTTGSVPHSATSLCLPT
eukprot:3179116-Rhodomonas_salina.3